MKTKDIRSFESTDSIHVSRLGSDDCLIDFEGSKVVLSYDAAYDLAMRLAYWLDQVGRTPEPYPETLN